MLHWAKKYNLVVDQMKNDFKIQEVKCRNPLDTNIDALAIIAAEFICDSVLACVADGAMFRFKNRKTQVVTDTIQIPSLFAEFKLDACRVTAPGIALFPDKREQLTPNRQSSDSSDGFKNPNGCQYRECTTPTVASPLISMLCSHIVCSKCTSSNGICKKCINKSLTLINQCGLQKQKSRANKYIDVTQLHLTKLPNEDDAPIAESTEEGADNAGSDDEREPDSDSDDSDDSDDDNIGVIEIVHETAKSRQVQAIHKSFLIKIEQLRLQHAAVPALELLPGALTADEMLPPPMVETAASTVPLPQHMDTTATPVPPLPDATSAAAQVPRLLPSMDAQVLPLPQPMDLAAVVQETPREMHLRKERERAKRNYCEHGKQRSKCPVCRPQQELKRKAAALSADSPTT